VKNLTWQNPGQLFVAQELIKIVKLKCCGIKVQTKKSKNENWYEKISDYDDADARDEHWWLG
jgi:hypothetical protein